MNSKINVLRKKVENIEKKIRANNNDGILEWAINQAEFESSVERNWSDPALIKAYRKAGIDREVESPKLQTSEAILAHAKEISEKYTSLDDYICKTIDPTPVRKVMDSIEREIRGKPEVWKR